MQAYAAHFTHPVWTPGVTAMAVDELKQRIADGELELGAALVKARTHKYVSKHRGPDGKWVYVYPEDKPPTRVKREKQEEGKGERKPPPGSQLPDAARERLKELGVTKLPEAAIPLAHIEIKLDPPHGIHQRAVISWKDRAGRRQNAYTPQFHAASAAEKWTRVMRFRDDAPRLVTKFQRDLKTEEHGSLRHQGLVIALVVANTGLRPGSELSLQSADHRGVSTLTAQDVIVKGDVVSFSFIGKSGKANVATLRNRAVAQAMAKYAEGGGRLFSSQAVQASRALLPEGMKLKDFRTIIATDAAMKALDEVATPPPLSGNVRKDRRMIRKALKEASQKVAERLNNTASVAQASYIHPVVFEKWVEDKLGAHPELWKSSHDNA
jgi:DNA topoisomerase-1